MLYFIKYVIRASSQLFEELPGVFSFSLLTVDAIALVCDSSSISLDEDDVLTGIDCDGVYVVWDICILVVGCFYVVVRAMFGITSAGDG